MAKNPETKVKFSVFNQEFNKALKEMGEESSRLKKEFKLQSEQMKDTATATEKLETTITYLGKQQDVVKRKISATEQQLEKAKQTYGENSNEANKLANKLLDLQISEQKLENSISQTRQEISKQGQVFLNTGKDAEKYRKSLKKVLDEAGDMGEKLTSGVTLPLAGAGAAAGASAINIKDAATLMTGSLGATGQEAKQLEDDMRSVWSEGFGDSPEQVARSMMMVKQNIQGLNDGKQLQNVTKNMLLLADATEADLGEATRGVNQIMYNFGKTADEAMNLFKKGHEEGLNYSQEMFDNISEYAPKFKDMGYSAEEYFQLLVQGAKNGAYNLDYINDAVKTFDDNLNSGSDSVKDAFSHLNEDTQELFQEFQNGGSSTQEVFGAVLLSLQEMENQTKANELGAELIGSKFEDMGAEAVYSLKEVNDSMDNVQGSMDRFAESQEEVFSRELKSTLRELQEALEPIGEELLDIAQDIIPHIKDLANWFAEVDEETQKFILSIGGLVAAAGPAITIFSKLDGLIGGLIGSFGGAGVAVGKKGFGGILLKLVSKAGPVGLGIAAIGGLGFAVSQLIDKKNKLNEVSLDTANSMMKEYEDTGKMISQFDQLRNKSKLSSNEFARYIDLQAELKTASSAEAVKAIKDEMNRLQDKSNLSNDELNTMIGLNKDLAELLPGSTSKISDQGNKIVGTTDELKKYNEEARKAAILEMKDQFYQAAENYNQLLQNRTNQQKTLNAFKLRENEINNYLQNYTQSELQSLAQKVKKEKDSLQNQAASAALGSEERANLTQQAHQRRQLYLLIKDGKQGLTEQLLTVKQQKNEQQQKLNKTDQEISKLDQVYRKLQLQYLKNGGINEQTARKAIQEGNIAATLDEQISKLEQQKKKLNEQYPPSKRNTDEYQNQISKINGQIGQMQTAKGKIQELGQEAYNYTGELGKDVTKNVNTRLSMSENSARNYTNELGQDVSKNVNAYVSPSAASINRELGGTVEKKVHAYMSYSASMPYSSYAEGTDYHPGGPAIVGEEGPELIRQGNKWSLHDFGMIPNLKTGADVFTHEQTKQILSGINRMPAYAGGVGVSKSLSNRLTRLSTNLAARQQSHINNSLSLNIEASSIEMDGHEVGLITWKTVEEQLNQAEEEDVRFGGG
ncbi:phage tail tape measure protein [Pontibacillus salicampi]|uniref:Phage tail tape measure protein n=1 Tax=Pontibacillus salicampi TaxID=1449801 RepID=A0ABV6LTN7_9BACI